MLKMQIQIKGFNEATTGLDKQRASIRTIFQETLRDVGEWYIQFLQNDVWETEGAVFGSPWAPLNPTYAKNKAKRYPGRGVLEATGKLRNSWKLYTTTQYALIENQAQNAQGQYYALHHQEGTGRLPQRTIAKIDEQRKHEIYKIFEEGFIKRFQKVVR